MDWPISFTRDGFRTISLTTPQRAGSFPAGNMDFDQAALTRPHGNDARGDDAPTKRNNPSICFLS